MKKILIGMLFCGLAFIGQSQNTVTTMTGSGDTITNATPDAVLLPVNYTHENLSVQIRVTKISGTVAGTAILSASNDGVNYVAIGSDTLTLTDVTTNTKIWPLTNANYLYYKVTVTGSGTMTASIHGKLYASGSINKHVVNNLKSSYNLNSDTCVNGATTYVGITVNNSYSTISLQVVITKISGTVAGTITIQASNDGTNYVTVNSGYITSTTHTATNVATSSKLFTITGSPYKYYRMSYTGSGTMSATIKGYLVANKK